MTTGLAQTVWISLKVLVKPGNKLPNDERTRFNSVQESPILKFFVQPGNKLSSDAEWAQSTN